MYGAQTSSHVAKVGALFENDVEMYGAQTNTTPHLARLMFENDVEMYGAQTPIHSDNFYT